MRCILWRTTPKEAWSSISAVGTRPSARCSVTPAGSTWEAIATPTRWRMWFRRGLECHVIDLAASEGLAGRLADLLEDRPVAAVIMLDIIEHLPDPTAVLGQLAELSELLATDGHEAPLLVTSIPNVAHFDLAAKLVGGRWDVTPSGLLDRTHLQLFTEKRVNSELGRLGWQECGREDVVLEHSDQWFPSDHPYLVEGGPVHDHLRSLRAAADPNMAVNQFGAPTVACRVRCRPTFIYRVLPRTAPPPRSL